MSRYGGIALAICLALSGRSAVRSADSAPQGSDRDRLYQSGVQQYARGDRSAALETFREGLRLDPRDRPMRAAVRRLESELAAPARSSPGREVRPEPPGRLERLFLVTIPRWFRFDRTLGDALSAVGTLEALNARVAQLLAEREFASAHSRPFRNDRLLRELLRRATLAAGNLDEV